VAPAPHADLLAEGVAADGAAFRALFAGHPDEARERLREAAALYRRSWELAPPRSFGRLVAHLKSAVLAGDGPDAAAYVRDALGDACDSPTSCYALALAALAAGDDAAAADPAERMRDGDGAFDRAAEALAALAAADAERYRRAVTAIVRDFEGRDAYLTGVPVADTAMLMEALAEPRGLAAHPVSPLLPDYAGR
jgi:tetratricopeptide (TPR) repeat protein